LSFFDTLLFLSSVLDFSTLLRLGSFAFMALLFLLRQALVLLLLGIVALMVTKRQLEGRKGY